MSLLLEMFTYPFIVRAFVVGVLVSLCAALLGVPLVLKRYSMIGDGLSHVSFGALAIALACGWSPLPVSIPVVILAALGLLRLTENSRIGANSVVLANIPANATAIGIPASVVRINGNKVVHESEVLNQRDYPDVVHAELAALKKRLEKLEQEQAE